MFLQGFVIWYGQESGDKVSYKESGFQVPEMFGNFSTGYRNSSRRFRKVPEWDPPVHRVDMSHGEVQQPTWAGRTITQKAHAAGPIGEGHGLPPHAYKRRRGGLGRKNLEP